MNISSLLSPQSSPSPAKKRDDAIPATTPTPRKVRSRPAASKRNSSLSHEVFRQALPEVPTTTPDQQYSPAQQAFPLHSVIEAAPGFRPLYQQSGPTSNPAPFAPAQIQEGHGYASKGTLTASRHSSTPQMETLAGKLAAQASQVEISPSNKAIDLASMQQQQPNQQTNTYTNVRHAEVPQSHHRPSIASAIAPPISRNASGQSLADLTMAEAPAQTPPRENFTSSILDEVDSQTVTDLMNQLNQNSYAYDSHVQLIGLLHKGFVAHVSASDHATSLARTYEFLTEMRQAREAMDTRFAVGEDIWFDWLADEMLLAQTAEERISVTEMFQKAVQDEPMSLKIWLEYGKWVRSCFAACNDAQPSNGWTEEDKEVCRELFTLETLANVYEQAVAATQWRVHDSHMIWNLHAELVVHGISESPAANDVTRLREMYLQRLQVPHSHSTETAQAYWLIMSRYNPNSWEAVMAQSNELAAPARKQMALRGEHEMTLERALNLDDKDATFSAFSTYLQWERKYKSRGAYGPELLRALYERALLRFPTYTEWWLDYIDLLTTDSKNASVLALVERATRHCPWSGDLWSRRILRSDVEGMPHVEIEATKHRATNSGLLAVGGMEELLKVLQQWCSYLRRLAFRPSSTEDELDTAEVGIASALEDIQQAGRTIYGDDFQGDPLYRLETIQIKFLAEARRVPDGREIYRRLVPKHKHSYDFWATYYTWELWMWGHERMSEATRVETTENGPHKATAVMQEALSQRDLDWPEKVLDMYLNHFQQHESPEQLQRALVEGREFSKRLVVRKAKEAENAAKEQPAAIPVPLVVAGGEKRKADDPPADDIDGRYKKAKVESTTAGTDEASESKAAQAKRDRENTTITIRNMALDASEDEIIKFFRDVGKPRSINVLRDTLNTTASATVEFDSQEDVLAAKTRNGRELGGREVQIQSGTQNTLYVANYPAEYDEGTIRSLFDSYGDIVSVRFPSLKYDSRRRFCYVTFLTEDMARKAEATMDNKSIDAKHKLIAKIANPGAKKQRSGAKAEGRELFVKNMDRTATEGDVKEFFRQFGEVQNVNLVKLVNNKRTGTGFIVYATAAEAERALGVNNKPWRDRILHVEISATNAEGRAAPSERAKKEDVIVKSAPAAISASPQPEPGPDHPNGRRGSDVSMASATNPPTRDDEAYRTARERKIAVFDLPDTVNDARIQAAMEVFGPITKIQLRREKSGAIVEFANINDAFNVRQGVDVSGLGEKVTTGDVADLLSKARKKKDGGAVALGGGMRPSNFSRPGQQRGGRRGGLGFKRGGGYGIGSGANAAAVTGNAEASSGNGIAGAKSNADFRAMLEKSKVQPAAGEDQAAP
ncbi:hypothetical protein LTR62_001506 [Meristemomyces frigidus]|uniref:RRM domain-containing protein n=1 Tax=Meristemomyces frigidus TaxID=1508187 RepID=A0AAN7THA8_9PEZI|nr:hypothetical protein LTR62_001506 [Meristemomyces frigidus]